TDADACATCGTNRKASDTQRGQAASRILVLVSENRESVRGMGSAAASAAVRRAPAPECQRRGRRWQRPRRARSPIPTESLITQICHAEPRSSEAVQVVIYGHLDC